MPPSHPVSLPPFPPREDENEEGRRLSDLPVALRVGVQIRSPPLPPSSLKGFFVLSWAGDWLQLIFDCSFVLHDPLCNWDWATDHLEFEQSSPLPLIDPCLNSTPDRSQPRQPPGPGYYAGPRPPSTRQWRKPTASDQLARVLLNEKTLSLHFLEQRNDTHPTLSRREVQPDRGSRTPSPRQLKDLISSK
jgi:hypothetical protein